MLSLERKVIAILVTPTLSKGKVFLSIYIFVSKAVCFPISRLV